MQLDELIRKIEAPLLVDVITRGRSLDDPTAQTEAALLLEMASAAGISDAKIQAELPPGAPVQRGLENSAWVLATARLLDHTPLGLPTINTVTHDVAVYLENPGVRMQVDRIVSEKLGDGPRVVVAHSLGTVVAYNVLTLSKPPLEVRRLITLGSPLGYNAVREKVEWPIAMPRRTKGWFNACDTRDIVAGFALEPPRFAVTPAIENKSDVDNDTDNRHGISGYLKDPVVARRIWEALH